MSVKTQLGIRPEHINDAAKIFSIAFQRKFDKLFGKPEEMSNIFRKCFNPKCAITAVSASNELMGVAGFHFNNNTLFEIQKGPFIEQFGCIKGYLKYGLLKALYSRKPIENHQLLMDGIAVSEKFRSLGIGKKLFAHLEHYSRENGMRSIMLDVIDENPKAKKLYESIGFVPVKHELLPRFIGNLIQVSGFSTMVKRI